MAAGNSLNRPLQAVFRTTWSESIGGGHLIRCGVLADELARLGWTVAFAAEPAAAMPLPGGLPYPIREVSVPARDEPRMLAAAWPGGVDLLVVDHMRRDLEFERACRPWARLIMSIDGLRRPHDCDLLLDPVNAESQPGDSVPEHCITLSGPSYAMLRPAFARLRPGCLARRRGSASMESILISFGAFDPHGLTETALKGVASERRDAAVRVILGGSSERQAALGKTAQELGIAVAVQGWVTDMAEAMAAADLAIGAAGSASWERCCLGLPSVAVVMADNQRPVAALLERHGAAILAGTWQQLTPEAIAAAVKQLSDDFTLRQQLIESAAALCDGSGAVRVAVELSRLILARPASTATQPC